MPDFGFGTIGGKQYKHQVTLNDGVQGVDVVAGEVHSYTNARLRRQFVEVYDVDGLNLSRALNFAGDAYRAEHSGDTIVFDPPLLEGDVINLNTSAPTL